MTGIRTRWTSLLTSIAAVLLGVAPTLSARAADGPAHASFSGNLRAQVQLIGGTGTFAFNSVACVFTDSDELFSSGPCNITASGTFNNVVCGTGTADGTAQISPDPSDGGVDIVNFHIQFAGGDGEVSGNAAGDVQISPTSPEPPPFCANGWLATGDITIP